MISSTTSMRVPDELSLLKPCPDSFWLKAKPFVRRKHAGCSVIQLPFDASMPNDMNIPASTDVR
jgi:hypothetical protein